MFLIYCIKKENIYPGYMRMLSQCDGIYPLASADSTNVARNFKSSKKNANEMATKIDSKQPKRKWFIQ